MNKPVFSICTPQVQDAVWARFPFKVPALMDSGQIKEVIKKSFRFALDRSRMGGNVSIDIKGSTKRIVALLKKTVS